MTEIVGIIRAGCGHVLYEHAEWLTPEEIEKMQNREICDDCFARGRGFVYDARIGSWVKELTRSGLPTKLDYQQEGDYPPEENVEDGDGFGL